MRLARNGRGVVGADKHGKVLARGGKLVANSLYDPVDFFDLIKFVNKIAVVTAIVGRFHMDIDEVESA